MKFLFMFLLGIAMIVSSIYNFIVIDGKIIIFYFIIWFVLFYWSVHKKNKERNTPRPVYLTNQ
jgi:Ca2+/Na+ antiporter